MQCLVNLMNLLGFEYSERKLKKFSPTAGVLGVQIDLSRVQSLEVLVRNKPGRVPEVVSAISQVVAKGSLTFAESSRIC